ncbi:MAG TPA: hypothetical protein VEP91_10890 [Solirubrobacterales bacterium]|nr:hypothetical protein [Solirubrobacterales bacterium]
MTERELRDLAWRLADGSEVFDFDLALEFARDSPAEAEELIRERETMERNAEEFRRLRQERQRALIEDFG